MAAMNGGPRPDDHVIVLFGGTGDLTRRKLLPGLFHRRAAPLTIRINGAAAGPVTHALNRAHRDTGYMGAISPSEEES
jgi:glucose-6-phosphate 1-dehydrogenase